MTVWALGSYGLFLTLSFGVRSLIHLRLTGELPWVRPSNRVHWVSEGLLAAGASATLVACLLSVTGVLSAIQAVDSSPSHTLGLVFAAAGLGLSSVTQAQMGRSWRAGVDPSARTELVTQGIFNIVRNPFYASMILAAIGVALMIPSALSIAAVVITVGGAEAVVRFSEEPYLQRVHGDAYAAYRASVGRFVPRLIRPGVSPR